MPDRSPASYHHGRLRTALIEAALGILRTEGLERLSLRAAARRAGVSQTAPYHHFSDKRSLLAAVAEHGFKLFHATVLEAAREANEPRERLSRLGYGYVQFALAEPALFRLMFGAELVPFSDYPELDRAAGATYDELQKTVVAMRRAENARNAGDETATVAAWAQVHGLAMLLLDGRVPGTSGQELALVRQVMQLASS